MVENGIFLASVLLMNAITLFLLLRDKGLNELTEDGTPLVSRRTMAIYGAVCIALNVAITVFFMYMYKENTVLFSLKRFALLSLLWPVGLIDFKTYRIPNVFVFAGLVFRAVLIIPELIFERTYLVGNLISELVAAVAITAAAFLCSICFKNSIGYGDMKLFIVMGLLLGLNGIWSAIFMSLVIAFFTALFLLVFKKKGRKDVVPFAPAMMIGTYLSVILTGM